VRMPHPKNDLIERVQELGYGQPVFETRPNGPDHEPTFISEVKVQGVMLGSGQGRQKKDAEREAAEQALAFLDETGGLLHAPPLTEAFDGPWPLFPDLLGKLLDIAHARTDPKLMGESARTAIQGFTLELYKGLLRDLGEVIEEPDESEETD
jgi:ribonuclease III